MSIGSVFLGFDASRAIDLDNPRFVARLKRLEEYLRQNYQIEELPNGWKCYGKRVDQPGLVVTPETVLFVMKNLGI